MFEKDEEVAKDGKASETRGAGNGEYTEKANDNNKAKTTEEYWAFIQRK